ncbi:DTW domain-containing protein [Vibrio sp. UCD-FRSSP16_10]|uniref:tRNA-uridine aminocarboxypropyltransferase n=1 Tax=unclassified Vibrio TaxID=2614977 RepID=UPI00080192AA|nr:MULTISPECIES: DTW domain-containing protein [unclassified Vibrio]OBT10202.1 DTW domain-containing protein [Vibrio sp. UCD-FRSSP16_30]OBT18992.1 DTW domain-containing protein [Vibrio sp. UCD-FRSSP16_10]
MVCSGCGFKHHCLCEQFPVFAHSIEVALLCHPNELKRATNTGKILLKTQSEVKQFVWSRSESPTELLELIAQHPNPILLFPGEHSLPVQKNNIEGKAEARLYIVLDATWQEAKKMWRQSPWLQALPQFHLPPSKTSSYSLRRNQSEGNLCTCEVGIELMRLEEWDQQAQTLTDFLQYYLDVFQADRCGHSLAKK